MPNTESEVIQTILKNGGKAKKRDIVKELGISLGYLDIITRSLERRGLVKLGNNVYFLTSSGNKKLAEFIQKKKKAKLKTKKKRGRPKGKWHPKEQRADPTASEVAGGVEPKEPVLDGTDSTKGSVNMNAEKPPMETLLGQRISELKEKVAEAEKKIEEGVKNIEDKIEKELEKKLETVEEKARPVVEKVKKLPSIILQFGKFLLFISKNIFNKCKKIKEKRIPKASLVFAKLRDFKVRSKLISIPPWIAKSYQNFTKKRS